MIKFFKHVGLALEKSIVPDLDLDESKLDNHERSILNFNRIATGIIVCVLIPLMTISSCVLWFYQT